MADRSSAALFAKMFTFLAGTKPLDKRSKDLAKELWSLMGDYDFRPTRWAVMPRSRSLDCPRRIEWKLLSCD